jgi:hypothetical protein
MATEPPPWLPSDCDVRGRRARSCHVTAHMRNLRSHVICRNSGGHPPSGGVERQISTMGRTLIGGGVLSPVYTASGENAFGLVCALAGAPRPCQTRSGGGHVYRWNDFANSGECAARGGGERRISIV